MSRDSVEVFEDTSEPPQRESTDSWWGSLSPKRILSKLSPVRSKDRAGDEEVKVPSVDAAAEQEGTVVRGLQLEVAALQGQLQSANNEREELKEEIRLLRGEIDSAREQGYVCNSQQTIHRHVKKHNTTL